MSKSRKIIIAGGIDWETYEKFSSELEAFESENDSPTLDVVVEVASGGGDAIVALAISARMRNSPCLIRTVCYGQASSAASLILASGDYRVITKEAWVMVHEDSGEVTGDVVGMEVEIKQKRRLEKQWCKLMAANSDLSAEVWEKLNKRTTYLSADQCMQAGIVDEVI